MNRRHVEILAWTALAEVGQVEDLFVVLAEFERHAHVLITPRIHVHPHAQNAGLGRCDGLHVDVRVVLERLEGFNRVAVAQVQVVTSPAWMAAIQADSSSPMSMNSIPSR
jgi:GNAT superfamily N-acetyltransferase